VNVITPIAAYEREEIVMMIFPPDVRKYIETRAKMERTTPLAIIRERMREVAEHDMSELRRLA
jgi:hypothetical protein